MLLLCPSLQNLTICMYIQLSLIKTQGCPRNHCCFSLWKSHLHFWLGFYSGFLFFGLGVESALKHWCCRSQVMFPFSQGLQSVLSVVQHLRTIVSYIFSSVLVGCSGRVTPKPVTPSCLDRFFRNARFCMIKAIIGFK